MRETLIVIFFLQSLVLFAQPGVAPTKIVDGQNYYVHKVQQGNTLWGLQQMYGVKVEEILRTNPQLANGLKTGEEILIQCNEIPKSNTEQITSEYKVKKGETLYGISRKFNTTVDNLIVLNPELQNGLQKGQSIQVPGTYSEPEVVEVIESDPVPNPFVLENEDETQGKEQISVSFSDSTIQHTVLAHETMYSISKRFMVKIEKIMEMNNLKSTTLKEGQVLLIPVTQERIDRVQIKSVEPEEIVDDSESITFPKKNSYKIAILIPLHLDYGSGYSEYVSEVATQFYMGSKMAIDSLKLKGLVADVYYFDTKNDSSTIVGILNKPEFKGMDLVIGPLFPKNQQIVADYCKKNKVRMVCPTGSDSKILQDNRLVYASVPSNVTLMKGLAEFMLENNKTDNIVLIKPTKAEDLELYESFRSAFKETPISGSRPALNESTIDGLSGFIRRNVNTVFVVPTADKNTANKFMSSLNKSAFRSTADNLYVYGTKEWVNFSEINEVYKNKYNFHYPSPNHLDYYTDEMKEMNKWHRRLYNTDLSRVAVQGYDVMMHFCSEFFLNSHAFLMMNDIQMEQISEQDGYENRKVFIVEQEDFELIDVERKAK